jgi:hypothetical protein
MHDDPTKPTEVYGASDDLIEFEGGFNGEHGCYDAREDEPVAIFLSDGSVLTFHYDDDGIWKAKLHRKGALFNGLVPCCDPDAERHSDTVNFLPGITWAYAINCAGPFKPVN